MSCRSRLSAALLGAAAAGLVLLAAAAPARADGMEPQPAPPKPRIVRPAPHHHHHARVHRSVREPVIGSVVKHVHDGYETPVYAMPAWPECRFMLDTTVVRIPSDNHPGYWDCGS
jgi:hypothetical protein